jgi:hypothetical protein
MNTFIRNTVVLLSVGLLLVPLSAFAASSNQSRLLLAPPDSGPGLVPDYPLPQFGFSSFTIGGVGERVTHVRWGGLASRLGLEPGDIIVSLNGYRLRYHGAWNDALYQAMSNGGWVRLAVRDVRTGHIAYRQTFVGGPVGPITPKFHTGGGFDELPTQAHFRREIDSKSIIRLVD